ncbi:MAG TPA: sigma-70 family RNA polymerase sigma factor [Acidimicrobiia bacterium]
MPQRSVTPIFSAHRPAESYARAIEIVSHGELLQRAAGGEREAWDALVDRFGQMVWSIARGYRLDDSAARDVAQTVWLRLIENISRIQDPERLPGWLATTCRREALSVLKKAERQIPSEFEYDIEDPSPSLESMIIDDEESREVMAAFADLDDECQQLLRLLTVEPALSYEEISQATGRPVGSLGPTRGRCLDRLKAGISRIKRETDGSS